MNEYIVLLDDEYSKYKDDLYDVGNVIFVSSIIKGVIGFESHYNISELLEEYKFIVNIEKARIGNLL